MNKINSADSTNNRAININYIWGLFETDGNFTIVFSRDKTMTLGYKMRPEFQITQKNEPLLQKIKEKLLTFNITSQIKTYRNDKNKRAPQLICEGVKNMEKLLYFKEKLNVCFYSIKEIDFQIIVEVMKITRDKQNNHNSEMGRKKIIDLKYAMHKPPKLPDKVVKCFQDYLPTSNVKFICENDPTTHINIPKSNRKERNFWEDKHNFPKNSSFGTALKTINLIHANYFQIIQESLAILEKEKLNQVKLENPFNFDPFYVAALIDGDGNISIRSRKNNTLFASVSLTFEQGSELIYLVVGSYFGEYNLNVRQIKGKNCTRVSYYRSSTLRQMAKVLREDHFQIKGELFAILRNLTI